MPTFKNPILRQALGVVIGGLVGAAITSIRTGGRSDGRGPAERRPKAPPLEDAERSKPGAKSPLTRKLARSKGKVGTANQSVSPSGRSSRGFAASVPRRVSHAYRSAKPHETRTSAHRTVLRRKLKESSLSNKERKLMARRLKIA